MDLLSGLDDLPTSLASFKKTTLKFQPEDDNDLRMYASLDPEENESDDSNVLSNLEKTLDDVVHGINNEEYMKSTQKIDIPDFESKTDNSNVVSTTIERVRNRLLGKFKEGKEKIITKNNEKNDKGETIIAASDVERDIENTIPSFSNLKLTKIKFTKTTESETHDEDMNTVNKTRDESTSQLKQIRNSDLESSPKESKDNISSEDELNLERKESALTTITAIVSHSTSLFVSEPDEDKILDGTTESDPPKNSDIVLASNLTGNIPQISNSHERLSRKERIQKLVEEKRRKRNEKEKQEQALNEEQQNQSDNDNNSDFDDDKYESSLPKRTPRQASKKAREEIERETQRMARNLQLAPEVHTNIIFEKSALFKKFGFKSKNSSSTVLKSIDNEDKKNSPISKESHPSKGYLGSIKSNIVSLDSDSDSDSDFSSDSDFKPPMKATPIKNAPTKMLNPLEARLARLRDIAAQKKKIKDQKHMSTKDLMQMLRDKNSEQLSKKQKERIDSLGDHGKLLLSRDELEKENEIIENLLEKEQQRALDLREREKQEAIKAKVKEEKDSNYYDVKNEEEIVDDDYDEEEEMLDELSESEFVVQADENENENESDQEGSEIEEEGEESERDDNLPNKGQIDESSYLQANSDVEDDLVPFSKAAKSRRRIIQDDDEEEEEEITPSTENLDTQIVGPPKIAIGVGGLFNLGGEANRVDSMTLSQAFDATISQTIAPQRAEDKVKEMRTLAADVIEENPDESFISEIDVKESFTSELSTQQINHNINEQATQLSMFDAPSQTQHFPLTQITQVTQKDTQNINDDTQATQAILSIESQDTEHTSSPVVDMKTLKRKLVQKYYSEEDSDEEDNNNEEGLISAKRPKLTEAEKIYKIKLREKKRLQKLAELKNSKAKPIIDAEAAESEDEWQGIGGQDGENSEEEADSDVERMMDDTTQKLNGDEILKLRAAMELEDDTKMVAKLLTDITEGNLRKRKGGYDLELSDDDADEEAMRFRKARLDRQKQKLLESAAGISKLANNPKAKAFIDSIAESNIKKEDITMNSAFGIINDVDNTKDNSQENPFVDDDKKHEQGPVMINGQVIKQSKENHLTASEITTKLQTKKKNLLTVESVRESLSFLIESDEEEEANDAVVIATSGLQNITPQADEQEDENDLDFYELKQTTKITDKKTVQHKEPSINESIVIEDDDFDMSPKFSFARSCVISSMKSSFLADSITESSEKPKSVEITTVPKMVNASKASILYINKASRASSKSSLKTSLISKSQKRELKSKKRKEKRLHENKMRMFSSGEFRGA